MDFDRVNTIIYEVQDNESIRDELFKEFVPFIKMKSYEMKRKFMFSYVDEMDLIQEGKIALIEAMYTYTEIYNAKFTTFAFTCIENRMLSAIKKANRKKHYHLNKALSFEHLIFDDTPMVEYLCDEHELNPYEQLVEDEQYDLLVAKILENLSKFEQIVFRYKLDGYTYVEIASILDKSEKQIDNAIQRIRRKVLTIIES